MYPAVFLVVFVYATIVGHSSANHALVRTLRRLIDEHLSEENNDVLVEQLSRILQDEDGYRLADRHRRATDLDAASSETSMDGSGDLYEPESDTPFPFNISVVAFTMVITYACETISLTLKKFSRGSSIASRELRASGIFDTQHTAR